MVAVFDRMVYIGKVLEIDDSDAKISFYKHPGTQFSSSLKGGIKFGLSS